MQVLDGDAVAALRGGVEIDRSLRAEEIGAVDWQVAPTGGTIAQGASFMSLQRQIVNGQDSPIDVKETAHLVAVQARHERRRREFGDR